MKTIHFSISMACCGVISSAVEMYLDDVVVPSQFPSSSSGLSPGSSPSCPCIVTLSMSSANVTSSAGYNLKLH